MDPHALRQFPNVASPKYGSVLLWSWMTGIEPDYADIVWTAANRAQLAPIVVTEEIEVTNIALFNGTVVNGNIDLGLYTADEVSLLPDRLLLSTGSVAQAGVDVYQIIAIASLRIGPGLYYIAANMDNGVGRIRRINSLGAVALDIAPAQQAQYFNQGAAFPLPVNATPSANSSDSKPAVWIQGDVVR